MSSSDEEQQVHITNDFSDDDSDNEQTVRIKIAQSDSDSESEGNDNTQVQSATAPFATTTSTVGDSTTVVDEEWDEDAMLDTLSARNGRRDNVMEEDKKLLHLKKLQQNAAAAAPITPLVAPPKKRLAPTKNEEKREAALQSPVAISPTPVPHPSAPPRYITHTIVHIDLTNIKTIEDIEEAMSRLSPDPTPYKDLVLLPTPAELQAQKDAETLAMAPKEEQKPKPEETLPTSAAQDSTSILPETDTTETPVITVVVTPAVVVPNKEEEKKKKEEEARRKKEEKESEEKRKKEEKEAEEKRKKEEKETEEKRKKEEKEAEEKRKKEEKEAEEKRKKEAKEAEEKRKKEEKEVKEAEKRRKKEEEKNRKNKKEVTVTAPEDNTLDESQDNAHESSVSRNSSISIQENRDQIRLAAAAIDFHAQDFPQPLTFEQARILLQDQQPVKIQSRFQKANVFGTSGYRKPDHRTCYFFQHLWQTDFEPNNKVHQLMLNAVYMHINEKVVIANYNNDLANVESPKSTKSEVPESTGQQWVDVMRSSDATNPAADLLGVTARYTILRPLECDLKPSVMTLYIALYILDGCPDANYKALIIALLRKFFLRDNAPKEMSYLELFAPIAYIINSLILSNTQVHSEPFYRLFYKYNLKKDLGDYFAHLNPSGAPEEYNLHNFIHLCIEYLMLLPLIFWFRHLIQRYDYPTLCAAVRQRLLSNIKGEFDRVNSEYAKGGYHIYINEVERDNYLAQDLKVVFAEQKKQKHMLTPLEQQLLTVQQARGPGRNSISYTAPSPAPNPNNDDAPMEKKIGPNIVVGKSKTGPPPTQRQSSTDQPPQQTEEKQVPASPTSTASDGAHGHEENDDDNIQDDAVDDETIVADDDDDAQQ